MRQAISCNWRIVVVVGWLFCSPSSLVSGTFSIPSSKGFRLSPSGSISSSGDTVVVGAFTEDSGTTGVNSVPNELAGESGAAYVFVRSGGVWSQQAYLKTFNTGGGDWFGISVAVSGDTVVEQIFREIRAFRIYDGPSEVHKWSLAKKIKRDHAKAS